MEKSFRAEPLDVIMKFSRQNEILIFFPLFQCKFSLTLFSSPNPALLLSHPLLFCAKKNQNKKIFLIDLCKISYHSPVFESKLSRKIIREISVWINYRSDFSSIKLFIFHLKNKHSTHKARKKQSINLIQCDFWIMLAKIVFILVLVIIKVCVSFSKPSDFAEK